MHKSIVRVLVAFVTAIAGMAGANAASLVGVGTDHIVSEVADRSTLTSAMSANTATGEYVVCYIANWATSTPRVKCRLFDENDQPIGAPGVHDFSNAALPQAISVDLDDAGNYFVTVITANFDHLKGWLGGWDRTGAAIMPMAQLDFQDVRDIDVTITPQGPWIGLLAVNHFGTVQGLSWLVRGYHKQGATYVQYFEQVTQSLTLNATFDVCGFDATADIDANRSGDVAFVYTFPVQISTCVGHVRTQLFRSVGTLVGPEKQLTDDSGTMPNDGANTQPQVRAMDDGRFHFGWVHFLGIGADAYMATLDRAATTVLAPTVMKAGDDMRFAAHDFTGDFVAMDRATVNGTQTFRANLAVNGLVDPAASFFAGSTVNGGFGDIHFLRSGQLAIVHGVNFQDIAIRRINMPALLEVNDASIVEGNPGQPVQAAVNLTLSKAQPNNEAVSASYFTRNGTATGGVDYGVTNSQATIPNGQTSFTVLLPITPDSLYEDDETFTVEIEVPDGALIRRGGSIGVVTIVDDDDTPPITPTCDVSPPAGTCRVIAEPNTGTGIDVTLNLVMAAPVGPNVQIAYTTVDGTAQAGSDYVARSGSVVLVGGSTTASIPLRILRDTHNEDPETFRVRLSAPDHVSLPTTDVVILITDSRACRLDISPPAVVANNAGDVDVLTLDTQADCPWTVTATETSGGTGWIHVTTQPASGIGPGTITVTTDPYPGSGVPPRTGRLDVAIAEEQGLTAVIPVDQNGDCDFAVTGGPSGNVPTEGASYSLTVTPTPLDCDWDVFSPVPWLTVTAPIEPVTGIGTVTFTVDPNAGAANVTNPARSVTLESDEIDVSLTQNGCTFALDPPVLSLDADDQDAPPITVTTQPVCNWTAVSQNHWIIVHTGTSGTGSLPQVGLHVTDNPDVVLRTGQVAIAGNTLTVNQDGLPCSHALAPGSITACPDGRTFGMTITATDGCTWSLNEGVDWISLTDTGSGDGDDGATAVVGLNLSETPRSSVVELRSGSDVVGSTTVTQEGYLTYEIFDTARPADWFYAPSSAWTIAGSSLVGQALGAGVTATTIDENVACDTCEIDVGVAVNTASSGAGDVLTVLGWYRNNDNYVGVGMDEFSNRWSLYQVVNGTRTGVSEDVEKIIPNRFYDVRLYFYGTKYVLEVDGSPLLELPLQSDIPRGSAGIRLENANGRIDEMRVSALQGGSGSPTSDPIFSSNFEPGESGPNQSQCQLDD